MQVTVDHYKWSILSFRFWETSPSHTSPVPIIPLCLGLKVRVQSRRQDVPRGSHRPKMVAIYIPRVRSTHLLALLWRFRRRPYWQELKKRKYLQHLLSKEASIVASLASPEKICEVKFPKHLTSQLTPPGKFCFKLQPWLHSAVSSRVGLRLCIKEDPICPIRSSRVEKIIAKKPKYISVSLLAPVPASR